MFEKDKNLMNGAGEQDLDWITTENGVHIPIKGGQTKKEAISSHFSKIENKEKIDAVQHLITTLKSIKKKKIKDIHEYIKNLEPISLKINDNEIVAEFDKFTADKNVYKPGNSDYEGFNYKLENIKELPQIIKNSNYSHSKSELGKTTRQHKGVKQWHYFINQINTDKGTFNVTINIRDKGNNQFVYEVAFKKKKT